MILPADMEAGKVLDEPSHVVHGHVLLVAESPRQDDLCPVSDGAGVADGMVECELTGGGVGVDQLGGLAAVVAAHQNNSTGRVPCGVSQSELMQRHVVLGPAPASLGQLQTVGGGPGVDSATENIPGESVPHAGTAGDGGEREGPLGGGYEELGLVVCSDQNTLVSVITVHGL